jgi:hypothetical protein
MRGRSSGRTWIALLLATALGSCGSADEQAIRQAFQQYKQALLDQDGERAAALVTHNTLDYYGEMRDLALDATRDEILDRRLIDRLTIALYRVLLGPTLEQVNARQLFVFSVDEGLIGSRSDVAGLEIGDVTVSGDFGTANATSEGQEAPLVWEFRREGDQWKLDLEALFPVSNLVLQNAAEEAGLTENQLIYRTLEARTGQRIGAEIWGEP